MKIKGRTLPCSQAALLGVIFLAVTARVVDAQQITGEPGSPSATTTINGEQIPAPPQKFGGKIERTTKGSKPYWPARIVPPKGAPNVLLIMTDDSGYGVPSTFGGVIPTPALDRIAANGLRYTNFHSTALCSPTRAALITGRNHHSVGYGVIAEQATGYPGYDSIITKDKATIGKILKDNGYRTSWFGKNHNTPAFQAARTGPFDQWPIGMGFEYFYGFMGGDTNQWQPDNLARNTTYIYPFQGNPSFNLITAMADEAIAYMNQINTLTPDQPFFVYYVPGGTHAPHHPTPEWIKKISDMHLFDEGWNKLRERIFENQKKLGVIPQNAKLTPWPKDLLKEWDQLTADEKKMFIRQVDVFAAYVAYTDHEIGRVIQAVEDMGKLDNTLIIYINGDNGTSAEGTLIGTPNEVAMFNGVEVPVADQLKYFYDVWGSDKTYNHMAVALGVGLRHAVLVDQADRVPLRRHQAGHGHLVAGGDQGQGRHPPPVPPRHRHRADDSRSDEDQAAEGGRRHQAEPDRRREHDVHLRQEERGRAVDPQDPVLRDDGRPRDLPRRLDRQHQGHAAALGHQRRLGRGPRYLPVGAVRSAKRLDAVRGRRGEEPGQAEGDAGALLEGGGEVPGAAARRDGGDAPHHAAPEHHGGPQRVHLDRAADRHAQRRCAEHPQRLVQLQGRDRGPAGRRRGHAHHAGRPLRRLRLLPAKGQAGLQLEPRRPEAGQVGRAGRRSRPASTRSSSTSSTTAWAWARWRSTT